MTAKADIKHVGVRIPESYDERIKLLAPDHIQGDRDSARRVCWALDEFFRVADTIEATMEPADPATATDKRASA